MKINRSNQVNFNLYKQHLQKQNEINKAKSQSDELQISKEALELQKKGRSNESRESYVQEIKRAVDSGEYKVDLRKTASKMLDFWSRK